MAKYSDFKQIIEESSNIVFFGGAGVSCASGIPDFRGTGGLYSNNVGDYGLRPEEILSHNFLMNYPEEFYDYYRNNMLYPDAEPNVVHYALAKLERTGKLKAVITQNIDGLHEKAGSQNVIELHGTVSRSYCVSCRREYDSSEIETTGLPRCECGGFIRPDVVMYGEGLPVADFYKAEELIAQADVLIVGGTSLTVNPAASLVSAFQGKYFIIINLSETPYDTYADMVIRDSLTEVFSEVI